MESLPRPSPSSEDDGHLDGVDILLGYGQGEASERLKASRGVFTFWTVQLGAKTPMKHFSNGAGRVGIRLLLLQGES